MPEIKQHFFYFEGKTADFFPSVGLKLSGNCRFKCPFCCEPNRTQQVYPLNNFISIANILKKLGTRRLCFTGGDPLSHKDIGALLQYTKSLDFFNLLLTTDAKALKEKQREVIPFVSAVRFSVHAIGSEHDNIVGCRGSFRATEKMIDVLHAEKIPCYVTTVITTKNIMFVKNILEWCVKNGIQSYFIFGLMRSGLGNDFIRKYGQVSEQEISNIISILRNKYSPEDIEIIYYDYYKQADCVLVYGDGKIIIDPYPKPPTFQLEIGNIFSDTREDILKFFSHDPKNYDGYVNHFLKHKK